MTDIQSNIYDSSLELNLVDKAYAIYNASMLAQSGRVFYRTIRLYDDYSVHL